MELHVDYLWNVLPIVGTGMLGVFLVTGVIIAGVSLLNALIVAVGRQKNEEVSGTFSQLENVWSKYNIFGKTEDES